MTRVNRPIHRETPVEVRSGGRLRPVIVSLRPPAFELHFRLKGERRSYELPIAYLFERAVEVWLAEEKARKKAAKKAKKELSS